MSNTNITYDPDIQPLSTELFDDIDDDMAFQPPTIQRSIPKHLGKMHDRNPFGNKSRSLPAGRKTRRKSRKRKGGVKTRFQKAQMNFFRIKAMGGMPIKQIQFEWAKLAKNGNWKQYIPPPLNPQEGGAGASPLLKDTIKKIGEEKTETYCNISKVEILIQNLILSIEEKENFPLSKNAFTNIENDIKICMKKLKKDLREQKIGFDDYGPILKDWKKAQDLKKYEMFGGRRKKRRTRKRKRGGGTSRSKEQQVEMTDLNELKERRWNKEETNSLLKGFIAIEKQWNEYITNDDDRAKYVWSQLESVMGRIAFLKMQFKLNHGTDEEWNKFWGDLLTEKKAERANLTHANGLKINNLLFHGYLYRPYQRGGRRKTRKKYRRKSRIKKRKTRRKSHKRRRSRYHQIGCNK